MLAWTIASLVLLGAAGPDYQVPSGCPDERAFWTEVRGRSLSIRSSTTALDVRITITASAAQFLGAVQVSGAAPRRLDARSCDDLARGLALVTALLIDAEPAPEAAAGRAATAERPAAAKAAAVKAAAAKAAAAKAAAAKTAPPKPEAEPEGAEVAVGAGVAVAFGEVPGAGLGVPLFAEVRWPDGPSFRALFRRAVNDASDLPLGAASFAWTAGRLEACPTEWALSVGVAMLCALVEGGFVDVEPMRVSARVSSREPWFGLGASARARTYFMDQFFLEGAFALTVPILRTHYYFSPGVDVFETPPISADVGVGVGFRFR